MPVHVIGYALFNSDREPACAQFFRATKDVRRILQNLSMASGQRIAPDTLIIFGEIQACEEALNSLKHFREDHVASAGSLLGKHLSGGFPVGQADFPDMGPVARDLHRVPDGRRRGGDVLPVEAKAGENVKAASIKRYMKAYAADTPLAVCLSMKNLSYDGGILNVPLFFADQLDRLIGLALG